jgi:hypothetical protein
MLKQIINALRVKFGYPAITVDGDALLREATAIKFDGVDALTFNRQLSSQEFEAIRAAWAKRYTGRTQ